MSALLHTLLDRAVLSPLDVHVAVTLAGLAGEDRTEVLLGAALASRQTREGHVCADLRALAGRTIRDAEGNSLELSWPELETWRAALRSSSLSGSGESPSLLVLDAQGRLYLRRYWQHEQKLAELIRARLGPVDEPFDPAVLRDGLSRLFPTSPDGQRDWQRTAAQLAVLQRFTVISGAPGTGKTSTVVKLLALLVEHARARGRAALRMILLAPTGKAAARLGEAIKQAKAGLDCEQDVKDAIVEEAATIHRALGSVFGSSTRFRHHAENTLLADVVMVDEASMVDVALMRRLLEAIPRSARLVLLGDQHQLASVESGTVLGDICGSRGERQYARELSERAGHVFGESLPVAPDEPGRPAVADSIVELTRSYRFPAESGIGALSRDIQRGDSAAVLSRLRSSSHTDVALVAEQPGDDLGPALEQAVLNGFRPYLEASDPVAALRSFDRFRVLCVHRRGPAGVERLNVLIENALVEGGLLEQRGRLYPGRPVLITQNDYQLGLFNGDVGIILPDRAGRGILRAYFVAADGSERVLSPARLPAHETVFATSVHKSQGSEFDEVALVLPDPRSVLLTRELLYTAVTRARRRVVLHGSEESVAAAVSRGVERASGLRQALWG